MLLQKGSTPGQYVSDQNQDLNGIASWLETQEIAAHYPAGSAQSMSSTMHPLEHTLVPRALSMFPKGREPAQAKLSNSGTGGDSEECKGASDGIRPNSTGSRLQLLKRRQQVIDKAMKLPVLISLYHQCWPDNLPSLPLCRI